MDLGPLHPANRFFGPLKKSRISKRFFYLHTQKWCFNTISGCSATKAVLIASQLRFSAGLTCPGLTWNVHEAPPWGSHVKVQRRCVSQDWPWFLVVFWWHIWPLHCGWNQHPFESQWRAGWNLSPCCQPHNNPEHPRLNKNLLHLKKTIATWTASKNNQFSSLKFNKKTYCLNLIFTEITTSTIKMQQEVSLSRHVQWEHLCTNIQSPYIRSLSVGLPTYQSINLSFYQSIKLSIHLYTV
jgi:hypothetical protein